MVKHVTVIGKRTKNNVPAIATIIDPELIVISCDKNTSYDITPKELVEYLTAKYKQEKSNGTYNYSKTTSYK